MDCTVQMMKILTEANGVPGFECQIRRKMEEYLGLLSDELLYDQLGSVVGKKIGDVKGPRILMAGHLDEVGFMVTQITEKGFLRFQPLGGWWPHTLLAHRVAIQSCQGEHLGIIGSKAPHTLSAEERKKVCSFEKLFIDVGARSREEVEEMGIHIGDPIIPISSFFTMRNGQLWGGKALDNRVGCAVAIEVLRRLQGKRHPNVIYSGATVQEEVGTRGAVTLGNLIQPDIALALDVGIAYDTPEFKSDSSSVCNIGEGPTLILMDKKLIPHTGLRNWIMDLAKELGVHLQYDILMGGGTDGGEFQFAGMGCPTIAICVPTRYIHSHNAIMARHDFEQTVTLITELVHKLDQDNLNQIMSY